MDDLSLKLDSVVKQLEALEARVQLLEHPTAAAAPAATTFSTASAEELPSLTDAVGVFTVLGRALLGIAGAYLLRAVAESSPMAMAVAAPLSIAYAFAWLIFAARSHAATWLAPTIYAATSATILAPLLWELTLRFHLLPASATAGILAVYAAAALWPAGQRHSLSTAWVAGGATTALSLALLAAAHAVLPFTCTLLAYVLLVEIAGLQGSKAGVRMLVAAAADLACWIALYVYASPPATRPDYPQLAPALLIALPAALFTLFAAVVAVQAFLRQQPVSAFLAVQTPVTLLLASMALLTFGSSAAVSAFGVLAIVLSVAGYVAALTRFASDLQQKNRRIFAAWSTLLLQAGVQLALSPQPAALLLALAATLAAAASVPLGKPALALSAAVWLMTAAFVGDLFPFLWATLTGSPLPACGWTRWTLCLFLLACPALLRTPPSAGKLAASVRLLCAALGALSAVALLVQTSALLLAAPSAPQLALVRTLALCATSVALAYAGARSRRLELTGSAYGLLLLAAVKLVAEDLRQGQLLPIAASIVVFALALIATPRLARLRTQA